MPTTLVLAPPDFQTFLPPCIHKGIIFEPSAKVRKFQNENMKSSHCLTNTVIYFKDFYENLFDLKSICLGYL